MLNLSRYVIAAAGFFSGLVTIGGFIIGFSQGDGRFVALACMFSGISLASYLWWRMTKRPGDIVNGNIIFLISFVIAAGLALYSNLVYLLWILDLPVKFGTIENGKMGQVYWFPPVILLYAVLAWLGLRYWSSKEG